MNATTNLLHLPDDLLVELFKSLPPKGACCFSLTCQKLRNIYNDANTQRELVQAHYHKRCPEGILPKEEYRRWALRYSPTPYVDYIETLPGSRSLNRNSSIQSLASIPYSSQILSVGTNGDWRFFDRETGRCLNMGRWMLKNSIECLNITPDGTCVLSESSDYALKLWDFKTTGECLQTLTGHTGRIHCLQITPPDATRVLSGSSDHTLKLWDLKTGECLRTLIGHTDTINDLKITPDGTRVLSGSSDHTLKFWDLKTGECLQTLIGHAQEIISLQITSNGTRALSGSWDPTLKLWDLKTGECLRTLTGHASGIRVLEIAPDGTRALSGSSDRTLKLWDLKTGECLQTLIGHTDEISHLKITPDGTRVLSRCLGDTLKLWDLKTGECLKTLKNEKENIQCLNLVSDDLCIFSLSGDHSLRFWGFAPYPQSVISKVFSHRNKPLFKEELQKLPRFLQNAVQLKIDNNREFVRRSRFVEKESITAKSNRSSRPTSRSDQALD